MERPRADFRPAALADTDAVLDLMVRYYVEDGYPFDHERARSLVGRFVADASLGRLWVLEAPMGVVGYFAVTLGFSFEYGGTDAFLDELYLAEGFRGFGFGSMALELAELFCLQVGVMALHLEVEPHRTRAQDLYRRRGFRESGRSLMTKRL
jgi:GNAT superfamily N-acetyltransferase